MKAPAGLLRVIAAASLVVGTMVGPALAQDSTLQPQPVAEAMEPWFTQAEERIESYRDAMVKSRRALDQRFGDRTPQLLEARVRQLLKDAGATDEEVAALYRPSQFTMLPATYRDFYRRADDALAPPLIDIGNATLPDGAFLFREFPRGNRAAIEAALAWLEQDMKLFRHFEATLPQFLADGLETVARLEATDILWELWGARIRAAEKEVHLPKGVQNVAARARADQLRAAGRALEKERTVLAVKKRLWRERAGMIAGFSIFHRYNWIVENLSRPIVTRTDPLIPLAEAFQRIEAHINDLLAMIIEAERIDPREAFQRLGERRMAAYTFDSRYEVGLNSISALYFSHINALQESLSDLQFRTGADPKDLDLLDQGVAQLKAQAPDTTAVYAKFASFKQQDGSLRQQINQQISAILNPAAELDYQGWELKRAGDHSGALRKWHEARALQATAKPLEEQRLKLSRAYDEEERKFEAGLNLSKRFGSIPAAGVVHAVALLIGGDKGGGWFRDDRGWTYSLDARWGLREMAVGVPVVLEITYERSLPEQTSIPVQIKAGDKAYTLTARVEPGGHRAHTEPFVLVPVVKSAFPVAQPSGESALETAGRDAGARPPESERETSKLVGSWAVTYNDRALGDIKGTATVKRIDGKLQAKVVLTDANSGRRELHSSEITEEGERFTLVLEGTPPSATGLSPARLETQPGLPIPEREPTDDAPYSGIGAKDGKRPSPLNSVRVELPDTADKILISVGDFNGELAVARRGPVDTDRVRLQLTYEPPDASSPFDYRTIIKQRELQLTYKAPGSGVTSERLVGSWSFDADPVTRRDGAGRGRVGIFVRDKFNPNYTGQVGNETWVRTIPPVKIQLFALAVGDPKRIDRLYGGVPTVVEAVFEEPQEKPEREMSLLVGERVVLKVVARRDPDDARRFVSEPFAPSIPEAVTPVTEPPPSEPPDGGFPFFPTPEERR